MSEYLREVPRPHTPIHDFPATVSASALDLLYQGMVLLEPDRRVSVVNRSARALLNQADGITLERQRLCFRDHTANARFQQLVDRALAGDTHSGEDSEWVVAAKRPSGSAAYHVVVSPLPSVAGRAAGVVVMIDDPESVLRPGTGALRVLFRLTAAQERLAIGLMAGKTLEEVAQDQLISKETVRAQLREIFAKTGVNRQSELMRLLSHTAITARCA